MSQRARRLIGLLWSVAQDQERRGRDDMPAGRRSAEPGISRSCLDGCIGLDLALREIAAGVG
jgi:hypothetical protein